MMYPELIATNTFECEKSCGEIIQKGQLSYFVHGRMVCLACKEKAANE